MHQTTWTRLRSRPRGEEQCHSHPGKINCLLHGDMRQICLYIYLIYPDIRKIDIQILSSKNICLISTTPTPQDFIVQLPAVFCLQKPCMTEKGWGQEPSNKTSQIIKNVPCFLLLKAHFLWPCWGYDLKQGAKRNFSLPVTHIDEKNHSTDKEIHQPKITGGLSKTSTTQ